MPNKEKIFILIDEMIKEAQEEPQWKAESALRCLKKELLEEQGPVKPVCIEYDRAIVLFSCRDCKTQLLYGQRYCHMCGRKVLWDET